MGLIALAVLFLLPMYYLAKSKGFNVPLTLVICALAGVGILITLEAVLDVSSGALGILVPALLLFVLWLIPGKKGAPGKRYLKISFACPECSEIIIFARQYEGKAELCPRCGEIVTIPLDEYSPPERSNSKGKSDIVTGPVCFASFGDEMFALQLKVLLEDHGISVEITGGIAGGALPQLSGTQGFRLLIDARDWDKATEIEQLANEEISNESLTEESL